MEEDFYDTSYFDTQPGSAGPGIGFFEGLKKGAEAGYEMQYRVDSERALDEELFTRWEENQKKLREITGEELGLPYSSALLAYVKYKKGEELDIQDRSALLDLQNDRLLPVTTLEKYIPRDRNDEKIQRAIKLLDEQNEKFKKAGLPDIDVILGEVAKKQKEIERNLADISERGGAGTTLGSLAGGIAGSFSTRDPLNVLSLFIPAGFGRTLAGRLASEAAVAGGTELAIQKTSVEENRRLAGLEQQDILTNVLYASAGAALFRVAFFELPAGVAKRLGKGPEINLDFDDPQLKQMFDRLPDTPSKRAAEVAIADEVTLKSFSTHGDSPEGLRRFSLETAKTELELLGKSDTAIARVIDQIPLGRDAEDFSIVKNTSPEIFDRYQKAADEVAEISTKIEDLQKGLDDIKVIDAIEMVDLKAAKELKKLELVTGLPEADKVKLADDIIKRVGKDKIEKAVKRVEKQVTKEINDLRRQKKNAISRKSKALARVRKEKEKLEAAVKRINQFKEGTVEKDTADLILKYPRKGTNESVATIDRMHESITKGVEELPERTPINQVGDKYDVGLDEPLPKDFEVPGDDGSPVSLEDVVVDLKDLDDLIDAMRVCST